MITLKETTAKNGEVISSNVISFDSYEAAQKELEAKAKADWKATEGIICEIKHDEDYYSRVANETGEGYYLSIRCED